MSKKSHQKRAAKRKAYRPGTHASQGAPKAAEGEPDASAFDIPDEVLKAPKEVSKLKFGLMVLLVIFLLLIFSIPSYDIFGGGQQRDAQPIPKPGRRVHDPSAFGERGIPARGLVP